MMDAPFMTDRNRNRSARVFLTALHAIACRRCTGVNTSERFGAADGVYEAGIPLRTDDPRRGLAFALVSTRRLLMNARNLVSAVTVALFTVACGYSIKTSTDYDRSVRFSNYHSFYIKKGNSSGNPLMDQRAKEDVASALTSKGWTELPDGYGQAAVVMHAATKTEHTYETFYDGWGGWRWRWAGYGGHATTYVDNYKVGTLVVDIFDAKTKQAIWHGFASDALSDNPDSNAKATEEAVDQMFTNFPPPSVLASRQ
jgi:uncharacterized protein DUF4136